jgi:hypothetical protein
VAPERTFTSVTTFVLGGSLKSCSPPPSTFQSSVAPPSGMLLITRPVRPSYSVAPLPAEMFNKSPAGVNIIVPSGAVANCATSRQG